MGSVSVIVPAYNAAPYVGEAIESLLAQTRTPDQIVLVNDGSTDTTGQVVAQYRDSRIHYVERPNGGIAAARNSGLQVATGDFIGFLDADDRWRPTILEIQLAVMEPEPSLACCFTNFVRFDDRTKEELGDQFRYYEDLLSLPTRTAAAGQSYIITSDPFIALVARGEIPCFMQTTLFRTRVLDGMRFNERLHLGEDYDFALRAYLRGDVAFVTDTLAEVRRHESNTTRDYHYFPVYKLQALQAIAEAVHGEARITAYRDRLVKAYIEAACVLGARGQFGAAARTYLDALQVPGSHSRKLKGAARLVLNAVQSGRGRAARAN